VLKAGDLVVHRFHDSLGIGIVLSFPVKTSHTKQYYGSYQYCFVVWPHVGTNHVMDCKYLKKLDTKEEI
jgi:hypothetical protein